MTGVTSLDRIGNDNVLIKTGVMKDLPARGIQVFRGGYETGRGGMKEIGKDRDDYRSEKNFNWVPITRQRLQTFVSSEKVLSFL